MAFVVKDRVKETTTTTGTGTVSLAGASTGFQSFSAIGNGNTTYYCISAQSGTEWEVGIGTYTSSGTTLSRDTVLSSSNGGSLVNFSAGTKDVFVTYPSSTSVVTSNNAGTSGQVLTSNGTGVAPSWQGVSASNGFQVGQVIQSAVEPSTGTWLTTNKTYPDASYPALASALGNIPDAPPIPADPGIWTNVYTYMGTAFAYRNIAQNGSTIVVGTAPTSTFVPSIMYSLDGGSKFFPANLPTLNVSTSPVNSVRYLNNKFIACTNFNVFSSSDGVNWTLCAIEGASTSLFFDSAYGSGVYVISTANTTNTFSNILYSTDAITWSWLTIPTDGNTYATPPSISAQYIAFGAGLFVIAGTGGACYTSPNGTTWTRRQFTLSNIVDLAYIGNKFVATIASTYPFVSTDGINWSCPRLTSVGTSTISYDRHATNGVTTVYAAISAPLSGSTLYTTTNGGDTWNTKLLQSPSASSFYMYSVVYAASKFVAVGNDGSTTGFYSVSSDGVNWTTSVIPLLSGSTTNLATSIAYGAGCWVVTSSGTQAFRRSTDLSTWTAPFTPGAAVSKVAFLNSQFVAIASNACYVSSNGVTWSSPSAAWGTPYDIAYGGGVYVVATSSALWRSTDNGVTWSNTGIGVGMQSVYYDGTQFVACGALGVYTSPTGATWTQRITQANSGGTLQRARWNGTTHYAVGSGGLYYTSSDAVTWTKNIDPSFIPFYDIAVSNGVTYFTGSYILRIAGGARLAPFYSVGLSLTTPTFTGVSPKIRALSFNGSNKFVLGSNALPLSAPLLLSSSNGTTWTPNLIGTPSTTAAVLSSWYVNGVYIALGGTVTTEAILTSPDGTTWTNRTSPGTGYNSAAYGAGVYVVVGAAGAIASSPDLATWTSRSVATANHFYFVAFLNSQFVAVGSAGLLYTSPDGITWTSRSAGANAFYGVIYANSLYVAYGVTAVYTSSDGVTWTSRTANMVGTEMIWDGTKFVYFGYTSGSPRAFTSTDGLTWTQRQTPSLTSFGGTASGMAWSGSRFVAVSSDAAYVFYSDDGIVWDMGAAPMDSASQISYGNGRFIMVGAKGTAYSTDGLNWTRSTNFPDTTPYPGTLQRVAYANGKYFSCGASSSIYTDNLAVSTDGLVWEAVYADSQSYIGSASVYGFSDILWDGSQYIGVFPSSGIYATSPDGYTWTFSVDVSGNPYKAIIKNGVKTIAFGDYGANILTGAARSSVIQSNITATVPTTNSGVLQGPVFATNGTGTIVMTTQTSIVYTSTDSGATWTAVRSKTSANNIVYLNNRFIALPRSMASASPTVQYVSVSTDGLNWSRYPLLGNSGQLLDAAYGAGTYVVVGANGNVFSSSDAITWITRSAGSVQFNRVVYVASFSLFVAMGNTGTIYTSPDGITWTNRTSGSSAFYDYAFGNNTLVLVGASGTVLTSTDGTTWISRFSNVRGSSLFSVTWNGSVFCAVGATGAITTSTDGVTWNNGTNIGASFVKVRWGNSLFVAIADFTQAGIYTSPDAITWTRRESMRGTPQNVDFVAGKFYFGDNAGYSFSSSNFTQYALLSCYDLAFNGSASGVYKFNNVYYATYGGTTGAVFRSTDGVNFNPIKNLPGGQTFLAYNGTTTVLAAIGGLISTGPAVFYASTDDGVTWTRVGSLGGQMTSTANSPYPLGLAYAGTKFNLILNQNNINSSQGVLSGLYNSPDGVTWTPRFAGIPYIWSAIVADGTTVCVSTAQYVFRSTDSGDTWTIVPQMQNGALRYSNGWWWSGSSATTDFSTFYQTAPVLAFGIFYATNNYGVVYYSSSNRTVIPLKGLNGSMATNVGQQEYYANVAPSFLPAVVDGSSNLILPIATTAYYPSPLAKVPLYSYNTSTTFYVPPFYGRIYAGA